jgi:hypothetical protein
MRRVLVVTSLSVLLAAGGLLRAEEETAEPRRKVLVELFTSQG